MVTLTNGITSNGVLLDGSMQRHLQNQVLHMQPHELDAVLHEVGAWIEVDATGPCLSDIVIFLKE